VELRHTQLVAVDAWGEVSPVEEAVSETSQAAGVGETLVDVPGERGRTVQVQDCGVADADGAVVDGPGPAKSAIVSDWHGKCVDVPNWNFADGQRLVVWNCAGGTNQAWEFTGGTLRTENNKCMDVAWGSTANGAAVQLATCSGNAAQQFVLNGSGDLVNPQANKCVDIADWNPNNDAVLQLWDCGGTANQKWHRG
jgi:hypothetical protein